jgi:hypothetical protein
LRMAQTSLGEPLTKEAQLGLAADEADGAAHGVSLSKLRKQPSRRECRSRHPTACTWTLTFGGFKT